MVQPLFLREQAARCRRLARASTDPGVRDGLLNLAEEYTAKADAQQQDDETTVWQANSEDQDMA